MDRGAKDGSSEQQVGVIVGSPGLKRSAERALPAEVGAWPARRGKPDDRRGSAVAIEANGPEATALAAELSSLRSRGRRRGVLVTH